MRDGMYDVLLKKGEVIDPSQGIHAKGSVAIKDGKIAAIGEDISDVQAKEVFNMEGKIVVPGLIDIHCHPCAGFMRLGASADEIGLNTGVTLLCDGGSSGASNFETMRQFIIKPAKTDMFCFLNLSTTGLIKLPEMSEILSMDDIDVDHTKQIADTNRDIIKGIKIRAVQPLLDGLGLKGIEIAKKLAYDLGLPLMIHLGVSEKRSRVLNDKMEDLSRASVSLLEKGDILSHYLTWQVGGMILKDGTVFPELEAARKRGVVLDACHGLNNFNFTIARSAIGKGLIPTVISTDMNSMNLSVVQSLAVVMSKFLNMGLSLAQVVEMTTINPAKALGEEGRHGSLIPGMIANITVMELVQGDYVFGDGLGRESMHSNMLLEPRMVFKGGKEVPAYSRYRTPLLFV